MSFADLVRYQAHPTRITGTLIEAPLKDVRIGELCEIRRSWKDRTVIARAMVLGFHHQKTLLTLIGSAQGLTREVVISPTGRDVVLPLSEQLTGCVINASGVVTERLCEPQGSGVTETRTINATPPDYHDRASISTAFVTGIRAIDALITVGQGQRMGIFASAGCGKTTLMQMIINNAEADLFVVALIGERGREVTEFVEELKLSGQGHRCVVVYATSDLSASDRMNSAAVAMTIAEYFRDRGKNVVLFLDSITRYARALRDVSLLAGEPPARRGYPASVFERLPALLERPGVTHSGSITAFFTILLESEDESDPIAEEIRSILDGHIILSRKLASKNHYPAIDVLKSLSRVSTRVCTQEHLSIAGNMRDLIAKIDDLQMLIDFGEYKPGSNEDNDKTWRSMPDVRAFLCQGMHEREELNHSLRMMHEIIS